MGLRFFSTKNRAPHLGPYPLERLKRVAAAPDLAEMPTPHPLRFDRLNTPHSLVNAMGEYQAMMDVIRDGLVNAEPASAPTDPTERAQHIKAFGYFQDSSMVGICRMSPEVLLAQPARNPDIDRLAHDIRTKQTKTLASGIDQTMAELRESIEAPLGAIDGHSHAIVLLAEHHRTPNPDEPGADWLGDAQDHRAALRATETAVILAAYLNLLGFSARAHTATSSDVDLNRLSVSAGLATFENGQLSAPFVGRGFGVAVVTTDMAMATDAPLAPMAAQSHGLAWAVGKGTSKSALNRDPYAHRNYVDGAHPFEKLKRVDLPTTFIDEARVARVPKRTDLFARAQFGDLGRKQQQVATGGWYVRKSAPSFAQRRALAAFVLLQDGDAAEGASKPTDAQRNAENVKAASYFLGVDAVGISRCPDWAWYSHDATGAELTPPHDQAISMIIDQGFETMEGASGDDWIAVAQSMRAYLRFSLLGGVIAKQIRNMGYSARAHSVIDGEVLQPPLLLLAGLGEVSRIGEVILNPLLGPRLKSGVVTTDMPMTHDKPIDFGLQAFCESCNKCARECPSGAITAGPMLQRIFAEGRRVFISKPINHFELDETASRSFLMGGGIGITPMIAFAHRLHALGHAFELHYSASRKDHAGYVEDLRNMPWSDRVTFHFSDQGSRADLDAVLAGYQPGWHVYTCGPDRFMDSVMQAAGRQGFPEEARHLEYFSVPEQPDYENHPFTVVLAKSNHSLRVPADKTLSDVLIENGVHVDVKCSDGICGVCKCGLLNGEAEHRDHVLSNAQRKTQIVTCQSRAAKPDGSITLDL